MGEGHPFDSVHGSVEEWALEDPDDDDPQDGKDA